MAHLVIKNIGPIKSVDIELNKVTVFIGPQSSGKSTIAKIISFCSWFEKQTILTTTLSSDFFTELLEFHNLEKEYFTKDSLIEYRSDWSTIRFVGDGDTGVDVKVSISVENIFHNKKIQYIPAERSLVSIPGIARYNDKKNNVWGFLYDWIEAKKNMQEEPYSMPLSSIGDIGFFYDRRDDSDNIVLSEGKKISLQHASSGLLSAVPLLVVFDYYVNTIYTKERIQSPFEIINIKSKLELIDDKEHQKLFSELMNELTEASSEIAKYEGDRKEELRIRLFDLQKRMSRAIGFDTDYNMSEIIIEEPELNLFPYTQQELVYYMLSTIMHPEHDHHLVLTTHSPYILFAVNNCILGGLIEDRVPDSRKDSFASRRAWIDPAKVSLFEIKDGKLVSLQDQDGLLMNNYLNQAYRDNSAEYLSLLNYYARESCK